MTKIRKRLTFEKAGKVHTVTIVGNEKSIEKLVRNLETDSGVESFKLDETLEV